MFVFTLKCTIYSQILYDLNNIKWGFLTHFSLSLLFQVKKAWFPTWSDTNQPVQAQKQARSLNFQIYEEDELYYWSSQNKGAVTALIFAFVFT